MSDALLEGLVRDQIAASRDQTAATSALTERLDGAIKLMQDHAEQDRKVHEALNKAVETVAKETKINSDFRRNIRKIVAASAAVIGFLAAIGKDVAVAAVNSLFHVGPPHP